MAIQPTAETARNKSSSRQVKDRVSTTDTQTYHLSRNDVIQNEIKTIKELAS